MGPNFQHGKILGLMMVWWGLLVHHVANGEIDGNKTQFIIDTGSTYIILDIGFFKDIESKVKCPLEYTHVSLRGHR